MSEIKIQREWLEGLLKIADEAHDTYFTESHTEFSINLFALMGYINSAKTILKNNK